MAITYLSGQRIQGISNADRTITDDLTTDKGWVDNGTGNGWEDSTNDAVDFKMVSPDASSGSDRDTMCILMFKIQIILMVIILVILHLLHNAC